MTPLTAMRGYLETLALPGAVTDDGDARALLAASSPRRRCGSRRSSATCSTWRASRAAAARSSASRSRCADLFDARRRAPRRVRSTSAGITLERDIAPGAPRPSSATSAGSSRWCRTSSPTPSATRRAADASRLQRRARPTATSSSSSRTAAPASRRAPAARLRSLLPRRPGARRAQRRLRPRPVDRPRRRRAARGPRLGRQRRRWAAPASSCGCRRPRPRSAALRRCPFPGRPRSATGQAVQRRPTRPARSGRTSPCFPRVLWQLDATWHSACTMLRACASFVTPSDSSSAPPATPSSPS